MPVFLVDATRINIRHMAENGYGDVFPEDSAMIPYVGRLDDDFPPIMQVKECDREVVDKIVSRLQEQHGFSDTQLTPNL